MKKLFNIFKTIIESFIKSSITMGVIGVVVFGAYYLIWCATSTFDTSIDTWRRVVYGLAFTLTIINGYNSKITFNSSNNKSKVGNEDETK